jgi:Kdo2-lipid IVA lauroyltransferase/acyltransferase
MKPASFPPDAFRPGLLWPWHWPMWLGIAILRAAAWLPHSWLVAAGRTLGLFAYYVLPIRRSVARTNIRICFPDLNASEREALVRANYASTGIAVFELAAAWYKPTRNLLPLADFAGIEHVEAALAGGRGVILLGGHFTTLEIVGRITQARYPFGVLYRKPNNPVVAWAMTRSRLRHCPRVIHFDDIAQVIRALRGGETVWYAPDQGKKFKYTEVAPFFGEPAVTNAATGRLASMGRATVIPFFSLRQPDGRYRITFYPPWPEPAAAGPLAEATELNRRIEAAVRAAPDQYLWLHKRFKRRGPGYPDLYASPPSP